MRPTHLVATRSGSSPATERCLSSPLYQPETRASPWRAGTAESAAGSRGNLLPISMPVKPASRASARPSRATSRPRAPADRHCSRQSDWFRSARSSPTFPILAVLISPDHEKEKARGEAPGLFPLAPLRGFLPLSARRRLRRPSAAASAPAARSNRSAPRPCRRSNPHRSSCRLGSAPSPQARRAPAARQALPACPWR